MTDELTAWDLQIIADMERDIAAIEAALRRKRTGAQTLPKPAAGSPTSATRQRKQHGGASAPPPNEERPT